MTVIVYHADSGKVTRYDSVDRIDSLPVKRGLFRYVTLLKANQNPMSEVQSFITGNIAKLEVIP